jgi:hypothetical protein
MTRYLRIVAIPSRFAEGPESAPSRNSNRGTTRFLARIGPVHLADTASACIALQRIGDRLQARMAYGVARPGVPDYWPQSGG